MYREPVLPYQFAGPCVPVNYVTRVIMTNCQELRAHNVVSLKERLNFVFIVFLYYMVIVVALPLKTKMIVDIEISATDFAILMEIVKSCIYYLNCGSSF
jgi:hypothetical protein